MTTKPTYVELVNALAMISFKIDDASGSPSFTAKEHDALEDLIKRALLTDLSTSLRERATK